MSARASSSVSSQTGTLASAPKFALDLGHLVACRRELLGDRLAPHARLGCGKTRLLHRVTGIERARLRGGCAAHRAARSCASALSSMARARR